MEDYEEAFNKVCRVCLTSHEDGMVSLFEGTTELSCYGKAVLTFSKVTITPTDNLPRKMCNNCLHLLKQAIKFKLTCESSDKQLNNIIKDCTEVDSKEKIVEYSIFIHYFPKEVSDLNDNNVDDEETSVNGDLDDTRNSDNDLRLDDDSKEFNGKSDSDEDVLDVIERCLGSNDGPYLSDNTKIRIKHIKREKLKTKCMRTLRKKVLVKKVAAKKYQCDVCRKVLANRTTYDNHMQRHTGFRFICEHCGKGFSTNPELQFHLVVKHGTGKYLQCEQCNFKAPRRYDLIEHYRIHSGERPYTCDQCGLTFRRRGIWRKHRLYHMDKSVQCPHCPRRFHLRSECAAHANNVHKRVYVFACPRCGATYAKPATVRRHLSERHGVPRALQGRVIRINKDEQGGGEFPE